MSADVALVGAFHTPLRRAVLLQSLEEMIFVAVQGALADAGVSLDQIDAVVLSTSDQVEGRVIESMVTNGAAGGVGRDVTTIASSGEHAFIYGCLRIRAKQAKRVLVVVWSKESEGLNPAHADLLSAEPFLLRPLGMTTTAAAGLQASAYTLAFGANVKAARKVRETRASAARIAHGDLTPQGSAAMRSWPLVDMDIPQPCDVACAVVLAEAEVVTEEDTPAWITGMGWVTAAYDLADRDLTRFEALEAAAARAFTLSGNAANSDVVEVQEISSIASFAACEALGLAPRGCGSDAALGATPIVNPSGGNLPANPGNATGVMRFVAAAQQVRGRAGSTQVTPRPRAAVGAALHGFAGQGAAVVCFNVEREAQ